MEDDHTTMAQQDQTRNSQNGGGNGRSSKKPKPKKVPQRGLGVAQLEKIRLEEQQKKNAAAILSSQFSLESTRSSPYMHLPIQNLHSSNQGSSLINLASSGSLASDFGSPMLHQQHMVDAKVPVTSTVPLGNSVGFEPGWPNFSSAPPRHGSVPEFDPEKEKFGVDSGFQFPTRLHFESNPIWSLPNLVPRAPPQYHQPQPSSSLVNVSSGNSPTPVPHFSIEPPSNQNHSGNSVPIVEDKLAGMKRQNLFSLDLPPVPPFTSNKRVHTSIERRTNPSVSCGSGSGFSFGAGNSTLREVSSCSASNSEPNSRKSSKENEIFNADFLTLAPPTPTTPTSCAPLKPKSSSSLDFLAFHNQENPEIESPTTQGIVGGHQVSPAPSYNRLFNQQNQPLFCFLPPAADEAHNGKTRARIHQNGNQVEESVDLNLKL